MHHFPNGTTGDAGGDSDDDGARDARVRPPRPEHPRLHRGEQGEDDRRERAASDQIRREAEDLKPLDDASVRAVIAPALARIAALPHVAGVVSPNTPGIVNAMAVNANTCRRFPK